MADNKPGTKTPEKDIAEAGATSPTAADTSGEVTNTQTGAGTVQREPKPEDYPPSAKVAPPAEQINSSLSQAVGTAAVPKQAERSTDTGRAIIEGANAAEKRADESMKVAEEIADKQRELDDLKTSDVARA